MEVILRRAWRFTEYRSVFKQRKPKTIEANREKCYTMYATQSNSDLMRARYAFFPFGKNACFYIRTFVCIRYDCVAAMELAFFVRSSVLRTFCFSEHCSQDKKLIYRSGISRKGVDA